MAKTVYTGRVGDKVIIKYSRDAESIGGKVDDYLTYTLEEKKQCEKAGKQVLPNYRYFGLKYVGMDIGKPKFGRETVTQTYEIEVGTDITIMADKSANINKWLRAVTKPTRSAKWWIIGLLTSVVGVGLVMLGDAIYRVCLSFTRKKCVALAKAKYEQEGHAVIF